jgi:ribosome-associated protein
MPGALVVTRSVTIPADELSWRFSRSSGPGGQSVNTTDSRVELRWDVTSTRALGPVQRQRVLDALGKRLVDGAIVVKASRQRSQLLNREEAERRLIDTLRRALARPSPTRRPTKPTKASVDRRIAQKKRRSQTKANRGSAREAE